MRWRARSASGTGQSWIRRRARLARSGRCAIDDRRDLLERHTEHVVQHERQPLRGLERLEDHDQREADRIGEQHLLRGVGADDGIRDVHAVADLARAQHVEADAGGHGGQPAAQVVDVAGLGPAEPEPGLLHGILGLAERAEHPVGHRAQLGAMGLEAICQVIHGHILRFSIVIAVTTQPGQM